MNTQGVNTKAHTFHTRDLSSARRHPTLTLLEQHLRARDLASVAPLPRIVRFHRPGGDSRGRRSQPSTRGMRVEGRGSSRTKRMRSRWSQGMSRGGLLSGEGPRYVSREGRRLHVHRHGPTLGRLRWASRNMEIRRSRWRGRKIVILLVRHGCDWTNERRKRSREPASSRRLEAGSEGSMCLARSAVVTRRWEGEEARRDADD